MAHNLGPIHTPQRNKWGVPIEKSSNFCRFCETIVAFAYFSQFIDNSGRIIFMGYEKLGKCESDYNTDGYVPAQLLHDDLKIFGS